MATNEEDYEKYLTEVLLQPARDVTPPPNMDRPIQLEARSPAVDTALHLRPSANPIIKKMLSQPNINEIKKNFTDDVFEYVNIDELPMRDFYETGVKIKFRELKVKEIEAFSALDESSVFDFKEKLNDIMERATIFMHPNGTMGSYTSIMDGDKAWLLYTIREKTFPNGRMLVVKLETNQLDDNENPVFNSIDIRRENIEVFRDEEIMNWYNAELKAFEFNTSIQPKPYVLAPPTIGLRHCFDQYKQIRLNNYPEEKLNDAFFHIVPFTQPHATYLSYDDLEKLYHWFTEELTPDEFDFFHDLFNNHMHVGIRGLKKKVGTAVYRSRQIYPDSPKSLFVLPNAFRLFCK